MTDGSITITQPKTKNKFNPSSTNPPTASIQSISITIQKILADDNGKRNLYIIAEVEFTNDEMIVLSNFKHDAPKSVFHNNNMIWYDLSNDDGRKQDYN